MLERDVKAQYTKEVAEDVAELWKDQAVRKVDQLLIAN